MPSARARYQLAMAEAVTVGAAPLVDSKSAKKMMRALQDEVLKKRG